MGSSLTTANGGTGGSPGSEGSLGGDGGDGRIRIEADSITGTTSPSASTASYSPSVTASENTDTAYVKFGSKSTKLVATTAGNYTTDIDPNSTSTHTLSAYVMNGTSLGGTVDSSVATLIFGGVEVTPTYTDMGGGWWRLTYSAATTDASLAYGVRVKPDTTIYLDGVQLEAKSYATTYTDGSLGTGYSWSGTAHESTSSRSATSSIYSYSGNIDVSNGTISIWVNPGDGANNSSDHGIFSAANSRINIYRRGGTTYFYFGNPSYYFVSNVGWSTNNWVNYVMTWEGSSKTLTAYINGSLINSGTYGGDPTISDLLIGIPDSLRNGYANSKISDLRIYNAALSATDVANLYYTGLQSHQQGSLADDRYVSSATYTSPVVDLSANGAWGNTPWSPTETLNGGTITYYTRTSADNSTWSSWQAVTGNSIASNARRYFQWKADLAPAASPTSGSPIITGATVAYVEDSTAPDNPTNTASGYSSTSASSPDLTSGNWYNYPTPKFTWDAGTDTAAPGQSASGVASYLVLFTTDQDAVPVSNTSDDCYAEVTAGNESYTVGTSNSSCTLSDGTYYLRLQTKDNSGNIASAVTLFTYKYDATNPNAPSSVATSNVGYQATNSFTFYWPAATDNGPSGVAGYEYKTGASSGTYSQWQFTTDTQVSNIPAYQEGQNLFYVRTKDNAGNVSGSTSNDVQAASFYYNQSAPTAPQNVTITPSTTSDNPATSNLFTVTWDKPASYSGEIAKYYYCVNCTPSSSTMTETTATETINRSLSNIALATQQGKNTFYIVAEDNNVNSSTGKGNVNYDAYASVDFYASTSAPNPPENVTLSDVSDRDQSKWRLSLAWDAPSSGTSPSKYTIYRSTDNNSFSQIGETSSTAYTDSGLTQSTTYYYKVYAVDSAGAAGLASATVSLAPEGKYNSAPSNGTPSLKIGSTTTTVSWSTDRETYGTVEYGKTSSYGFNSSESSKTKNHSIKLTGLTPGTTYYYRVQALDDSSLVGYSRSDAYSGSYSFTTLAESEISEVQVTDITLNSAVISWKTASLSTSEIDYGETTEYGSNLSVSVSADESIHTARLTKLKHSTKYHFRIKGTTVDGDDIFSQDYSFQTLIFPKVTAVVFKTAQSEGGTAAVLAFATNVPTSARVEYQAVDLDRQALNINLINKLASYLPNTRADQLKIKDIKLSELKNIDQVDLASLPIKPKGKIQVVYDPEMAQKHVVKVPNLNDGSMYVFTIKGFDKYGNETSSDPIRYITGADTVPPQIRNVQIETPVIGSGSNASGQIIVSFETDEPSKAKVRWGAGTGREYSHETSSSDGYSTRHVVVIRDLELTTTYHLQILASDRVGNQSQDQDIVVVTPAPVMAAFDLVITNLEDIFGFLNL